MSQDDDDDDHGRYLKDPADPSIRVDEATLIDWNSTPEQCVQFVDLVQKTRQRPGRYIKDMSIRNFVGLRTLQRIAKLAQRNRESQWLNGDGRGQSTAEREYTELEYYLKTALVEFDGDKAPVLERLGNMLEWFMEFFAHRRMENWQSEQIEYAGAMEDEIDFWRRYFDVLKNLALGFGFSLAYFEGFRTESNPFLIQA